MDDSNGKAEAGDDESRRLEGAQKPKQPRTWSGRHAGLFSPVGLAWRRLGRGWNLLLVVGVGILVAVVLICTVPLYDALVTNIQLQRAINTGDPTQRNLQASVDSTQISTQMRDQSNQVMTSLAESYLHSFTSPAPLYYAVSGNMLMLKAGSQAFDPDAPAAPELVFEAFDYQAAGPHMHFLSGTVPEDTAPGQTPEVAITQRSGRAGRRGWAAGSRGRVSCRLVAGAIVDEFPTLYPGGFIVMDLNDYLSAVRMNTPNGYGITPDSFSPNEFWIRTTARPSQQGQLLKDLANSNLLQTQFAEVRISSLAEEASQIAVNPVSAGIRGLLLVGAFTAAVLAILGSIVQALIEAQQRTRQFAVMRTLGVSSRQLTRVLLGQQLVVYAFGRVGGTLLGLLLVTATLPFLQVSDSAINPATVGIPPYILTFDGASLLYFYLALLLAFLVALLIASRYATSLRLGDTLRLGED